MWEYINYGLLAVEIIAIIGLLILNSKSKNNKKTRIIQLCIIFVINFTIFFVSRMEDMIQNTNADASNPFGNLLPFMLMSEGKNDFKDIMLMSMLNGNTLDANPLVLYSLMNENGNDDFMKFMLLSQMNPSIFNFNLNGAPADDVSNS